MTYTLYNKRLERRLDHPTVGLWYTLDLKEAKDMLLACQDYLRATGLGEYVGEFVVIEVDGGKEVE